MVINDLNSLDLNLDDADPIAMGRDKLKRTLKFKLKEIALKENARKLSKIKGINYKELKTQDYLFSPVFDDHQRRLLFLLRSRMVDVKANFRNQHSDSLCPSQCALIHTDSQENLLVCPKLKGYSTNKVRHADLFKGTSKQLLAVTEFSKL